jgi:NifU-like protein involved in Fe-S cluster formation
MPALDYSPLVERYFAHPIGAGTWPAGVAESAETAVGEAGSEELGTRVRFSLRTARGAVTEARFQAFGCPHTIAAASWLAEHLRGRALDQAMPMPILDLGRLLEVPTEKLGRLLVVEDALRAALARAETRQE